MLSAFILAAVTAVQPYRLSFTCQQLTDAFLFDIKVADRASGEIVVNRKIDALANVPAKIAPTVDGREFNLRALVRPDGRAEVSLDVVEEKATPAGRSPRSIRANRSASICATRTSKMSSTRLLS
jgi:hypothetical protein